MMIQFVNWFFVFSACFLAGVFTSKAIRFLLKRRRKPILVHVSWIKDGAPFYSTVVYKKSQIPTADYMQKFFAFDVGVELTISSSYPELKRLHEHCYNLFKDINEGVDFHDVGVIENMREFELEIYSMDQHKCLEMIDMYQNLTEGGFAKWKE